MSKSSHIERRAEEKVKALLLDDKRWELVFPSRQESESAQMALAFIQGSNLARKKVGNAELSLEKNMGYQFRICTLSEAEQEALIKTIGNGNEYEGYCRAIVSARHDGQCILVIDDEAMVQTQERLKREQGLGK